MFKTLEYFYISLQSMKMQTRTSFQICQESKVPQSELSLWPFVVLPPSGKNPDSESWNCKKPVSSLDHEKRQIVILFHLPAFQLFPRQYRRTYILSSWTVNFNYSMNKFQFSCILPLFNIDHVVFVSLHSFNFMGCPTFLKEKVEIEGC